MQDNQVRTTNLPEARPQPAANQSDSEPPSINDGPPQMEFEIIPNSDHQQATFPDYQQLAESV